MDRIIEFFITSSILTLFIMVIRKYFRGKVKHKFIYGLWLIVFLRFCFPINFVNSSFSIMNGVHQLQGISTLQRRGNIEENKIDKENRIEQQFTDNTIADWEMEKQKVKQDNITSKKSERAGKPEVKETQTTKTSILVWVMRIWILGVFLCFAILLYSNLRFYKTLKNDRKPILKYHKGKLVVYQTDKVSTPCLFGVCKPAIYIPDNIVVNLSKSDMQQVLDHEQMHYKHLDHIWSLWRCIIVSIYWFDPLIWVAAKISKQDAEFACDEGVLEKKSYHERIAYGEMLLHVATHSKRVSILCPVTAVHSGKKEMKKRMEEIRMKKKYQKSKFLLLAVALGVGTAVTFTGCGVKESTAESIIGRADTASTVSLRNQTEEKTTEKINEITVSEPVLDMIDITGADGVRLYYADDKKLIFAGCFGLFVYDRTKEEVFRSVDLKPIGCNMTQGDNACEISVSEDGETVYLHCVGKDEMYVYDINGNKLSKESYNLKNIPLYQGVNEEKETITYTSNGKKKEIALVGCFSFIGDLGYWENGEPIIPIFMKSPYKDTKSFKPEDIHDLKEAVMYIEGKEYKINNANDLKWIEEHYSNPIEEIKGGSACPFYNPMYLLREDGISGMLYPALDSCPVYRTAEDKYYKYERTTNDKFLKMLGKVQTEKATKKNGNEIFDTLNQLEYQPYTCDGLPEYQLTATDGTVYAINFSGKWVWRGNSEQAELLDELITQLKEDSRLVSSDTLTAQTEDDTKDNAVWGGKIDPDNPPVNWGTPNGPEIAVKNYYADTVFELVSIEITQASKEHVIFTITSKKDGILVEPNRTIELSYEDGKWKVVNEGY